jgi:type I restriction enzyme S subunit
LLASNEEVAIVPMASVSERGFMEVREYRPANEVSSGLSYFADGDVLVAKITPCYENNKITRASVDRAHAFGSTEFHVLRPKGGAVDAGYLTHFLRQDAVRDQGARRMTGSGGQRRVPRSFLEGLEIPLPPLDEQRRIAAILDQADALRRKRREALSKSQRLLNSIFEHHFPSAADFGPGTIPLGTFAEIQVGHAFQSANYTQASDGIRLCRGTNVLPNRLDWTDLARWPSEENIKYAHLALKLNDIVIAMDRPWISEGFKIAQVKEMDLPALLVQRVARVRATCDDLAIFLFHLLRQPHFTKHCKPTETTVPHISPKEIRNYRISPPSSGAVAKFSDEVRNLKAYEDGQAEQLVGIENLFASLQHRAFRGEL